METLSVLEKAAVRNIYGKVDNIGPEREEILAEVANKYYILSWLSVAAQKCDWQLSSLKQQQFVVFQDSEGWLAGSSPPDLTWAFSWDCCIQWVLWLELCSAGAAGISLNVLFSSRRLGDDDLRVPVGWVWQLQGILSPRFKNLYAITYTKFYVSKQEAWSAPWWNTAKYCSHIFFSSSDQLINLKFYGQISWELTSNIWTSTDQSMILSILQITPS